MLLRILTMHVDPAKVEEWMRYTRDIGFPGMLAQPGCRQVWRLRARNAASGGASADFQVMTVWDGIADLERFRASQAMKDLTASAGPLFVAPTEEQLFDILPDPA